MAITAQNAMKAMMHVWLERVKGADLLPSSVGLDAKRMEYTVRSRGRVQRLKLTLVSPPWPQVGDEVRYLGRLWLVTKTSGTRGTILPLSNRSKE